MNKQRIVAGLASVAMASTLVACSGGSSSNAKTLTVSVNQSLTDSLHLNMHQVLMINM